MIDEELLEDVRRAARSSGAVKEVGQNLSDHFLPNVAAAFGIDSAAIWWWETLKCSASRIHYGDADALDIVKQIVGNGAKAVRLAITDDEPAPWPLFEGDLASVLKLISEQRYFEYFLVDEELSWLIFDNHHNDLIVAGSLKTKADGLRPGSS